MKMASEKPVIVSVVLGSESDIPTVESGLKTLEEFGLGYELRILSAHRTPTELADYVHQATEAGVRIFIAAAGMAAALPGVIAAHTPVPVIGVPVSSGSLGGMDALLAISQMPPGVPVATMSIGSAGAKNAALMAVRILALSDAGLMEKLKDFTVKQRDGVLARDKKIAR
jgi:phosphoribosylaminoimidazole carboxylase PurE protein